MNYSSEETLRIQLPFFTNNGNGHDFSVIGKCDGSHIKSLIIQQAFYDRYIPGYSSDRLVTIPETISRLVAVETIKINACIRELPVALSKLTNLKLLDLSGCYNLLSIPDEILKLKDLKIKNGDIISRASEVVFIEVPPWRITPKVFSKIRTAKEKKIKQLIIRQIPPTGFGERPQEFEVPDEIKDCHELKLLSITGNISSVASWIRNMSTLCSLTVNYSRILTSLPESIGNLSNLTSLDLSYCSNLVTLPSSIGNLSQLFLLNLSESLHLVSLPESIGNLSNLTSLKLSGCRNLKSLPSSIGNLSNITSLKLSGCDNLTAIPTSLHSLSHLEIPLRIAGPIRYGLE